MVSDSYERLGGASVRGNSRTVPVPQRAINVELLKLGGEAYWGVREDDGAVVVSQLYDPLADDPGIRFLTSTVLDEDSEDRLLPIPDAVFDHWDDLAGGGIAVEGGTRVEFVTGDDLADDEQLLVLPEWQVDDVVGETD